MAEESNKPKDNKKPQSDMMKRLRKEGDKMIQRLNKTPREEQY